MNLVANLKISSLRNFASAKSWQSKISAIIAFFKFTFKGQIMNKKSFKSTFQPLEIALKKALGIRKIRKGKIFNESGFALASKEKITRYIFFLPLFQKLQILTNATEFGTQIGGGQNK